MFLQKKKWKSPVITPSCSHRAVSRFLYFIVRGPRKNGICMRSITHNFRSFAKSAPLELFIQNPILQICWALHRGSSGNGIYLESTKQLEYWRCSDVETVIFCIDHVIWSVIFVLWGTFWTKSIIPSFSSLFRDFWIGGAYLLHILSISTRNLHIKMVSIIFLTEGPLHDYRLLPLSSSKKSQNLVIYIHFTSLMHN
jgi:hypothetical protein